MSITDFDGAFASDYAQKIEHLIPITPRPELCFIRGEGQYLYDHNNKSYLDMIQGWAVNTLGHCSGVIQTAIAEQSQQLINPGPAFYNSPMLDLAQLLCQHSVFNQAFFANSGAEANEGAIKLARKWGQLNKKGAFKIITFEKGFHGRTLATMSATGKDSFVPLFEPKVGGFNKAIFNDIQSVEAVVDDMTVAVMLELVQGEAGVIEVAPAFVAQLETLCQKHNLLLIIDEVQTGIGRTGKTFCYEHFNLSPDILTLGKGLGGGVPISALLTQNEISCFEPGDQGGTFNGNPIMCAAALSVLNEVLSEGFMDNVQVMSRYLKQQLSELSAKFQLGEVRGKGLLIALDTADRDAKIITERALDMGLLLNAPRIDTLRFMPALTITEKEIDKAIELLEQVLSLEH